MPTMQTYGRVGWLTIDQHKPGHDEKFSNHSGTFPNVFLNQLWTRDPDESTVSMMSHSPSQQGFSSAGGTIKQDSLLNQTKSAIGLVTTGKQIIKKPINWKRNYTFGWAIPRLSNNSGCLIGSSMTCENEHISFRQVEECPEYYHIETSHTRQIQLAENLIYRLTLTSESSSLRRKQSYHLLEELLVI